MVYVFFWGLDVVDLFSCFSSSHRCLHSFHVMKQKESGPFPSLSCSLLLYSFAVSKNLAMSCIGRQGAVSFFPWLQRVNDKGCFFLSFFLLLFPFLPWSCSHLFGEVTRWKSLEMRDLFRLKWRITERGITFSYKFIFSLCTWISHLSYMGSTNWQRC